MVLDDEGHGYGIAQILEEGTDLTKSGAPAAEEGRHGHYGGCAVGLGAGGSFTCNTRGGVAHGDDEGHAALDPFHNEGDEFLLFSFGEEMAFRGVGQCDEAVDAAVDTELDEPFLAGVVDGASRVEAGGEDGEDPSKFACLAHGS